MTSCGRKVSTAATTSDVISLFRLALVDMYPVRAAASTTAGSSWILRTIDHSNGNTLMGLLLLLNCHPVEAVAKCFQKRCLGRGNCLIHSSRAGVLLTRNVDQCFDAKYAVPRLEAFVCRRRLVSNGVQRVSKCR